MGKLKKKIATGMENVLQRKVREAKPPTQLKAQSDFTERKPPRRSRRAGKEIQASIQTWERGWADWARQP